jgi:hypothetical protein
MFVLERLEAKMSSNMIPATSFAHSAVNASMAFEVKIRELLDAIAKDLGSLEATCAIEILLDGKTEPSENDWDHVDDIAKTVADTRDLFDTLIEADSAYLHRRLPAEIQRKLEELGELAANVVRVWTKTLNQNLIALTIKNGGSMTREAVARIRNNSKAAASEAAQLEAFKVLVTRARECGVS